MLSGIFEELKFDEEFIEISAEAYKMKNMDQMAYTESSLETLNNELNSLLDKELTLADGYSSKIIREEVYKLKIQELGNRRTEINQQIKNIKSKGGAPQVTFERIKSVFIDGNKAANQYLLVGDTERRHMLEKLLSNATVRSKNIVSYQFKREFQPLANASKKDDLDTMLASSVSESIMPCPKRIV